MSVASAASRPILPERALDRAVVALALALLGYGFVRLSGEVSLAQGLLFVVGGLLGVTLYHAAFGFTGGWRAFVLEGRGAGLGGGERSLAGS